MLIGSKALRLVDALCRGGAIAFGTYVVAVALRAQIQGATGAALETVVAIGVALTVNTIAAVLGAGLRHAADTGMVYSPWYPESRRWLRADLAVGMKFKTAGIMCRWFRRHTARVLWDESGGPEAIPVQHARCLACRSAIPEFTREEDAWVVTTIDGRAHQVWALTEEQARAKVKVGTRIDVAELHRMTNGEVSAALERRLGAGLRPSHESRRVK